MWSSIHLSSISSCSAEKPTAPSTPKPPALLTATTTSRQCVKAKIGNSMPRRLQSWSHIASWGGERTPKVQTFQSCPTAGLDHSGERRFMEATPSSSEKSFEAEFFPSRNDRQAPGDARAEADARGARAAHRHQGHRRARHPDRDERREGHLRGLRALSAGRNRLGRRRGGREGAQGVPGRGGGARDRARHARSCGPRGFREEKPSEMRARPGCGRPS